jgi:hypothetical protein
MSSAGTVCKVVFKNGALPFSQGEYDECNDVDHGSPLARDGTILLLPLFEARAHLPNGAGPSF